MADKIYTLYQENKDRPVDDKFITDVFEYMMEKEPDLLPYVKDFIITDSEKKVFGQKLIGYYSLDDRTITGTGKVGILVKDDTNANDVIPSGSKITADAFTLNKKSIGIAKGKKTTFTIVAKNRFYRMGFYG